MAVEPARYRPPFASERLLPKTIHGFNGCRVAATWMAVAIATLGESTLNKNGTPKGTPQKRADLTRMRAATGEPNRPGFNTSHTRFFVEALDAPVPELFRGSFAELWADKSVAYTIAGNPSTLKGASKLEALAAKRSWSGADHELLLTHVRDEDDGLIFDPMVPQSGSYKGDRIPKHEIRQFMLSDALVQGGVLLAEVYPVGGWTAAEVARRRCARRLEAQEADLREVIKKLRVTIKELQENPDPDIDQLIREARLDSLNDALREIEALKAQV